MTNMKKVIKALEDADVTYGVIKMSNQFRDVLVDLLKEQEKELTRMEPIEPVDDGHGSLICGNQGYECGCVGRYDLATKVVEKYCNFCPECGRKVKWNE